MRPMLAVSFLVLFPISLSAQSKPVEFGIGIFSHQTVRAGDRFWHSTDLNGQGLSVTFYMSERVGIEPTFEFKKIGLGLFKGQTDWSAGLAVPIYFADGFGHEGTFFRPSISFARNANLMSLGAGLGQKFKISDDFSIKLEAGVENWTSTSFSGGTGQWRLKLGMGLSFYPTLPSPQGNED